MDGIASIDEAGSGRAVVAVAKRCRRLEGRMSPSPSCLCAHLYTTVAEHGIQIPRIRYVWRITYYQHFQAGGFRQDLDTAGMGSGSVTQGRRWSWVTCEGETETLRTRRTTIRTDVQVSSHVVLYYMILDCTVLLYCLVLSCHVLSCAVSHGEKEKEKPNAKPPRRQIAS